MSKEAPRTETNRGQNKFKIRKSKTVNSILPVWSIVVVLFFIILNLFRASCFEFRAFSLGHLKLFRSAGPLSCCEFFVLGALRPFDVAQGMLCASHRNSDLIFMNQSCKYTSLVLTHRSGRTRRLILEAMGAS